VIQVSLSLIIVFVLKTRIIPKKAPRGHRYLQKGLSIKIDKKIVISNMVKPTANSVKSSENPDVI